ncbi:TIGR04438 family Trp-rich protein [Parvibium lacunae]|uniref:TIGR04438 family Trp-rich protein n=1 Tax=Parvibium lacunae TaxID=1888893 RepID=A0A368L4W4_9BURK|nr:TIGR04438 family Trp-rich protein [Parvibium lacunae]RCS58462.1 TIGR04438 family Trp-rich protein [Parvibium lacunae]
MKGKPMWFVYIGIVTALLKYLEQDWFRDLSWWQVLIPFGLAFAWWEVFEPMFGFDKKAHAKDEYEEGRKKRIKDSWKTKSRK